MSEPIELVGLFKPFVLVSDGLIERQRQSDVRADQWSRRYSRSSWYSLMRSSNQARSAGARAATYEWLSGRCVWLMGTL